MRLWDPATQKQLATFTEHTSGVTALAWGELDGRPVLASSQSSSAGDINQDKTVRLWDPATAEQLGTITGHTGDVTALAWGELDGRPVLASGSKEKTVWLWDPVREREWVMSKADLAMMSQEDISEMLTAQMLEEGRLKLAGAVKTSPGIPLSGHTEEVTALAWGTLDGRPMLASASTDNTVRLWDPSTRLTTAVLRLAAVRAISIRDPLLALGQGTGLTIVQMQTANHF